jgi:hypothetical protein
MNFESPYWLIPIFIFLFAFIYWARTRKDPLWHRRIVDRANKVMAEVPAVITPQYKKKVYYEPGVGNIDLTAVDEGFNDTMDRLACQGYPVNKEQHDLNRKQKPRRSECRYFPGSILTTTPSGT